MEMGIFKVGLVDTAGMSVYECYGAGPEWLIHKSLNSQVKHH